MGSEYLIMEEFVLYVQSGLVHADFVTTVSPTYAKEVLTPDMGEGLHTTLRGMTKKFFGVVNGIDEKTWDPATDPHLEHHYSVGDMSGKQVLKNNLRRQLGLSMEGDDANRPLVSSPRSQPLVYISGIIMLPALHQTVH
jgi:starch synthase